MKDERENEFHLEHVQAYKGRAQPTTEIDGMPVNDDIGLESEADRMSEEMKRW